jgi:protein-L-isoaspartate(D-aspartate) O-methyltransferase
MFDGAKVYSIERQNELFKQTSVLLPKLGIRPKHLSLVTATRFAKLCSLDSIIVTAGVLYHKPDGNS